MCHKSQRKRCHEMSKYLEHFPKCSVFFFPILMIFYEQNSIKNSSLVKKTSWKLHSYKDLMADWYVSIGSNTACGILVRIFSPNWNLWLSLNRILCTTQLQNLELCDGQGEEVWTKIMIIWWAVDEGVAYCIFH